jgi:hypothetical protein
MDKRTQEKVVLIPGKISLLSSRFLIYKASHLHKCIWQKH